MGGTWLDCLASDQGLYLWGSYAIALGLVATEIALLAIRERTILGHLGWTGLRVADLADPGRIEGPKDGAHR